MSDSRERTVAAYDADVEGYAAGTAVLPEAVREALDGFAALLPAGARVLEIGSGPGRDARELEARGLSVRRTDVTPAFVELIRAGGHEAEVLDPLTDDLTDHERDHPAPYDGVWANACLLHVARADLPVVLARLAGATRGGGVLYASVKEGDGEAWSTHGKVRGARHFTYWREGPLRAAATAAGWTVSGLVHRAGERDDWLDLLARRPTAAQE